MAMAAGMNAHMGLVHALAMPLCGLYAMPHGQACGMALPYVLEFNAEVAHAKVAAVFRAMGLMSAEPGDGALSSAHYRELTMFLGEVGIAERLSDFGYRDDHMPTIVRETLNSVQSRFNPRTPSEDDLIGLMKRLI